MSCFIDEFRCKNNFKNYNKAIKEEYDCYDKLDSAKSEDVIGKKIDKYEKADRIANEKIQIYEDYHFLYLCIIEELRIFDNNGDLRDRKEAEANIEAGLDLLETLRNAKITKAVTKLRRTMPGLLNYFDTAKSIVADLMTLSIGKESFRALCLAWQWGRGVIKSMKAKAQQYCCVHEQFYLELAADYLQEDYDLIKEQVYMQLDQIVQSSALVETINSIECNQNHAAFFCFRFNELTSADSKSHLLAC